MRHEASFDSAVLTVSCPIVSRLCPQLTRAESERLARVVYQGVVCPSWLLKRPLAGFYVTNITDKWVPFTGVIETTALVDRASFGGNTLVYLPRYLTQDDAMWNVPDEQISEEFFAALCRMVPGLAQSGHRRVTRRARPGRAGRLDTQLLQRRHARARDIPAARVHRELRADRARHAERERDREPGRAPGARAARPPDDARPPVAA